MDPGTAPVTDTGTKRRGRSRPKTGESRSRVARTEVEVLLRGRTPIKPDPMTPEQVIKALHEGQRPPPDKEKPVHEVAAEKLYRGPDGQIVLPEMNIVASWVEAGVFVKIGRAQISTTESTLLYALIDGAFVGLTPLLVSDGADGWRQTTDEDWQDDVTRGMMRTGFKKVAVAIIRPRFNKWAVRMRFNVDLSILDGATEEAVKRLITIAGRVKGLCGHRPGRKGPFGQYEIGEWRVLRRFDAQGNELTAEPAAA